MHTSQPTSYRVALAGRFSKTTHAKLAEQLGACDPPIVVCPELLPGLDAVFVGAQVGARQREVIDALGLPVLRQARLPEVLRGGALADLLTALDGCEESVAPNALLARLRTALSQPDLRASWRDACALLGACGPAAREVAADYTRQTTAAWDDPRVYLPHTVTDHAGIMPEPFVAPLCPTPPRWYAALARADSGALDPRLRTIRHLRLHALVGRCRGETPREQRRPWMRASFLRALETLPAENVRWLDLGATLGYSGDVATQRAFVRRFTGAAPALLGLSFNGALSAGIGEPLSWVHERAWEGVQALDVSGATLTQRRLDALAERATGLRWLRMEHAALPSGKKNKLMWPRGLDTSRLASLHLGSLVNLRTGLLVGVLGSDLGALEALNLQTHRPIPSSAALRSATSLARLRVLNVSGNRLDGRVLAKARHLEGVRVLIADRAHVYDADALAQAPLMREVRVLMMRVCAGAAPLIEALARHRCAPQLEMLVISQPTEATQRALLRCAHMTRLRALVLHPPEMAAEIASRMGWGRDGQDAEAFKRLWRLNCAGLEV